MDPNALLSELLGFKDEDLFLEGSWSADTARNRCERYAIMLTDLDGWLTKGGFLPSRWQR